MVFIDAIKINRGGKGGGYTLPQSKEHPVIHAIEKLQKQ